MRLGPEAAAVTSGPVTFAARGGRRRRGAAADRVDVVRRLRGQVGRVGAGRDGRRPRRRASTRPCSSGWRRSTTPPIYRIDETTALVSTTDFFPPLVDDPADYGAIAAANACSDVFAMGGRVVLAINVAAFPEHFPPWAMSAIFDAAADGRRRGRRHRRRRAHDPQPRAGVRAGRAGPRAPRPRVPQGRRPAGRRRACCPSRSAPGSSLAGGDDDEKAAVDRRDAPAQPRWRRRRCSRSAGACTPSPTSPATAWPGTGGRSPSAAAPGSSSTPARWSPTRALARRPSAACAPAAMPATASTSPATSTSTASAVDEALVPRPADVGRAAGRRRPGRGRRPGRRRVLAVGVVEAGDAGGRPAVTARSRRSARRREQPRP